MDQLLNLLKRHLPNGGAAHMHRGQAKTTITLTLEISRISFPIPSVMLQENGPVAARLFVRNTVLSAIKQLTAGTITKSEIRKLGY